METIKTFVVDRMKLNREGFRHLFANTSFEVIGEASDLVELAQAIECGRRVDCAVLDVDPGNVTAFELIARARQLLPDARIVGLTSQSSATVLHQAFAAGANGLLHRDISGQALLESLRLVMSGEKVFPSALISTLLYGTVTSNAPKAALSTNTEVKLSQRELEVLQALGNGRSNKQIANLLDINEATVKAHFKNIQRKLKVINRTQAAIWALNAGLSGGAECGNSASGDGRPEIARDREPAA